MPYILSESWKAFNRLITRFKLEPSMPSPQPVLSTVIVPVTNFDDLLQTTYVDRVLKDISAASGITTFYTVPDGKRWRIIELRRDATTANSSIRLVNRDASKNIAITNAGTSAESVNKGQPYQITEGWTVGMDNTNNVGDNNRGLNIFYYEEDAY